MHLPVNSPMTPAAVERDVRAAIAIYFGICTRSSSWLAVSGWLRYLNLTASGTRVVQSQHPVRDQHFLGVELLAYPPCILDADLGEFRVDLRRLVARIHPIHGLAVGPHEATIDVGSAVEIRLVGDEHPNRMPFHQRKLGGSRDDPDLALAQRLHGVGRSGPAGIDLPRHDHGEGRRKTAGCDQLGIDFVELDEGQRVRVRRRTIGGIRHGAALHVRHRFDRRFRAHIPIRVLSGRFRTDDADRRTLA